jgi:type 1 glutamine amidotransferase
MNLVVISGGRNDLPHPFEESTPILGSILKGAGHEVTVTDDPGILADAARLSDYDALAFNTVRAGDNGMTKAEQAGMTSFIEKGKGFVCIHVSTCASDDWPEYYDITGGGWILGKSSHPPYGRFTVNIANAGHPVAQGVSDFVINDELYMNIEYKEGNELFITSDFDESIYARDNPHVGPIHVPGGTFPLGWTRTYGSGRVFVTMLGHDGRSLETPEFQRIVLNGVDWVTSKD